MCALCAFSCNSAVSDGKKAAQPEWKKRLPIVQADMRRDCSKSEARKTSEANKIITIYQLQPRMFTPEGTMRAAEKLLPHIKELGVDAIYICPLVLADDDPDKAFWSRRQKKAGNPRNPYRLKDYFKIDPEYGTEADVKSFVAAAHKLGMRVIFDLVYYHCGPTANLLNMDKDFVRRDAHGNVVLGRWNFPELNFDNPKLREYMWGNMEYFVKEFDIDGYRTDVEHYVPLDFWEEGARRMRKLKPNFLMLAESRRPACQLEAYDINYDWTYFEAARKVYAENAPASSIVESEKNLRKLFPKNARVLRYTENHDEAMNYGDKRPDMAWPCGAYDSALFAVFALDGVPLIYNGIEVADNAGHNFLASKAVDKLCINWSMALTPKGKARFELLKRLVFLRKKLPALVNTWAEWLDNTAPQAVLSFARTYQNQKLVGMVNTKGAAQKFEIDVSKLGAQKVFASHIDRGAKWSLEGGTLNVELAPYGFALLELR